MAHSWKVLLVSLTVLVGRTCVDSRTLDGGRLDADVFTGYDPLMEDLHRMPMIRVESEGELMLGLNDIQSGLMDKGDNDVILDPVRDVVAPTTIPPPPPPTVPEVNAVVTTEGADENLVEENPPEENTGSDLVIQSGATSQRVDVGEEDYEFDDDIFHSEDDFIVIMRRMYEALTKRLNVLKTRVNSVEQTAGDVLARLTVLDCADLLARGKTTSGVYTFHMDHNGKRPVAVYCDMDTEGGGWTVLQRRLPHSKDTDFNRGWHDYKMGFGDASSDYWIGLENMYIWTNTRHYEMRIDLTDFEGAAAYAKYDRFYVESEAQNYRLHVSGYNGTAGDSMTNGGKPDNFTSDGMMFTTHDNDHDTSHEINCAKYWKIGGWWFNRCSWANLNGPYREPGEGDGIGINWHMWRNKEYLRSSTIMIRPSQNL